MSSLLTNSSAMTALQTLRSVASNLNTTQSRIATGQRVATASDNAAYWSIATSMRADNAALSAVSDSLGLSAATVDTEYTALTSVIGDKDSGLTKLQALLVEAKTAGIDRAKLRRSVRTAQHDPVQHARQYDIVGVAAAARQQAWVLHAGHGLGDAELGHGRSLQHSSVAVERSMSASQMKGQARWIVAFAF